MARKPSKRRRKPEPQGNLVPALLLMAVGAFAAAPFYRSQDRTVPAGSQNAEDLLNLRQTLPLQIQPRIPIADQQRPIQQMNPYEDARGRIPGDSPNAR